jgi:hypothetical protein
MLVKFSFNFLYFNFFFQNNFHMVESLQYGNFFLNQYFLYFLKKTSYINMYILVLFFIKNFPLFKYYFHLGGYIFFFTTHFELLSLHYNLTTRSLQSSFVIKWRPGFFSNFLLLKTNYLKITNKSDVFQSLLNGLQFFNSNVLFFLFNSDFMENVYFEISTLKVKPLLIVWGGPTVYFKKHFYFFPINSGYFTCFFFFNFFTFFIKNLYLYFSFNLLKLFYLLKKKNLKIVFSTKRYNVSVS